MVSVGLALVGGAGGFFQEGAVRASVSPFDPLVPDSVLVLSDGPTLVTERAVGLPVLGIRVSAPLDPPWPGAARVLVDQALERSRPLADALGSALRGGLEAGRIVYHVTGDLRDADELAWIARRLAGPPVPDATREPLEREAQRMDALAETAQGRMIVELEGRLSPSYVEGTVPVTTFNDVRELWRRSFARDRIRVFVLGDIPMPLLLAELSRFGAPPVGEARYADPGISGSRKVGLADTPLYAWSAAVFSLGPSGDAAVLAAVEALKVGLRETSVPRATLRLHRASDGAPDWIGITARALRKRDADEALGAALALMTEEGLGPWWWEGVALARNGVVAQATTPDGWLTLADRYFSPEGGGWIRGALDRLESLRRRDLDPLLEVFRATLLHPRIDA